MPRNGASTAPAHVRAPEARSHSTEPVAVRIYQPRISASISKPIDVARSAGHWKRKLRTAKGARAGLRAISVDGDSHHYAKIENRVGSTLAAAGGLFWDEQSHLARREAGRNRFARGVPEPLRGGVP